MHARALLLALGLLLAPGMAVPAEARQELWLHDGAEVAWQSLLGLRQVIRFREPRAEVESRDQFHDRYGGDVLFSGWRRGNLLSGHARTWRAGCPWPFRYRVRGLLSDDGMRAVLEGPAPVIEDCRIVGFSAQAHGATLVLVKLSERPYLRRRPLPPID